MNESKFIHGEMELAAAVGLAVKHFQRAREKKLARGVDWDLNGLHVAYAKNAVPRVLLLVTGEAWTSNALADLLQKTAPVSDKKNGAEVDGVVAKFFLNPRLLAVRLPSNAVVIVRVKERKNFRIGMQVPVRLSRDGRHYELARKLPRYPGRF